MASRHRRRPAIIPVPIAWVVLEVIRDGLADLAAKLMAKAQIRLAIVAHELELELDLGPGFQAAAEVYGEGLGAGDTPVVAAPDRAEERTWCPIDIHAGDEEVKFPPRVLSICDGQAPLEDEGRDGDVQLRHDAGHQVVGLRKDPEVGEAVQWRLLEVADRQECGALAAWDLWDLVGGGHRQRGAQDEKHIGLVGVRVCALKVRLGQVLAKVDDAVEQGSTTDCALATCAVVMHWTLVGGDGPEIWKKRIKSAV